VDFNERNFVYKANDQSNESTKNPQEFFSIAEHKDDSTPTKQLENSNQENDESNPEKTKMEELGHKFPPQASMNSPKTQQG